LAKVSEPYEMRPIFFSAAGPTWDLVISPSVSGTGLTSVKAWLSFAPPYNAEPARQAFRFPELIPEKGNPRFDIV